ncbi:MAG: hypothetical protein ABIH34_00240 [Nanoarchaeota archaeon]
MRLHKLSLRNIRSYLSVSVEFPEGRLLLCGDIGSGKSTILQAIEFAFFGIKKGELLGTSLLRHGKREGWVELVFMMKGKEYLIKRTLRRTKEGVKQEAGFLLVDGLKKEGTAVELRSWILELLGYPAELLSKGKDYIYRYTVYTPQEEMKAILFEDPENRLDILRRVFQIDKYKRIRENSQVLIKHLREEVKLYEGRALSLGGNEREAKGLVEKAQNIAADQEILEKDLLHARAILEKTEGEEKTIKEQLDDYRTKKEQFESNRRAQEGIIEERSILSRQHAELKEQLGEIPAVPDVTHIDGEMRLLQDTLIRLREEQKKLQERSGGALGRESHARKTAESIQKLEHCPLCLQQVSHEHKQAVVGNQEKEIALAKKERGEIQAKIVHLAEDQKDAEKNLEQLRKQQEDAKILALKAKQHLEKKAMLEQKEKRLDELKKKIGEINGVQQELSKTLLEMAPLEALEKKLIAKLKEARDTAQRHAIKSAELRKEKEGLTLRLTRLQEEIMTQKKAVSLAKEHKDLVHWLQESFVKLMSVMEQHVMGKIHQEFNLLFSEWFSQLVDDQALSARLDDRFTPVINQDGYETELAHLSGGERTSCALAYRLALNKVINDITEHIETKDLIILDEPTDGFSTEQLDKVREVLDVLDLKQVIIVSHENKIESFVDSVIRIQKDEHVSQII